jgi:hypothetical protein
MISFFKLRLWSSNEDAETPEMGLKASSVQCGSAHIGGAKTNQLDAGIGYNGCSTGSKPALESA